MPALLLSQRLLPLSPEGEAKTGMPALLLSQKLLPLSRRERAASVASG